MPTTNTNQSDDGIVEVTKVDRLAADALFRDVPAFRLSARSHAQASEAFARHRLSEQERCAKAADLRSGVFGGELDDRLGFVGNAGGGKTYSAGTAVERCWPPRPASSSRPLGRLVGLRSTPTARPRPSSASASLVIFGGPHGDLPLTEHAGA
jgi:hypothetical protein